MFISHSTPPLIKWEYMKVSVYKVTDERHKMPAAHQPLINNGRMVRQISAGHPVSI